MNSGIYAITAPGLLYIGATEDLTSRWDQHLKALRANQHWNRILQDYFSTDPRATLRFAPLVRCPMDHLAHQESALLAFYASHPNLINKTFRSGHPSPVAARCLRTQTVIIWPSVQFASAALGTHSGTLSRALESQGTLALYQVTYVNPGFPVRFPEPRPLGISRPRPLGYWATRYPQEVFTRTQTELAETLGTSAAYVSRILNHRPGARYKGWTIERVWDQEKYENCRNRHSLAPPSPTF